MQIAKFIIFVYIKIQTMKYIVRAVKYFIYICVLVSIILLVMVLAHFVSSDINVMFKEGWKSVAKIALVFAGIAAIYPLPVT